MFTILQLFLYAHHNLGGNTPFFPGLFESRIKNHMLQLYLLLFSDGPKQMRYWRWLVDNPIDDIASLTRLVWSPPLASKFQFPTPK